MIINYVVIIMLIYLSGNILLIANYYAQATIAGFIGIVCVYFFRRCTKEHIKLRRGFVASMLFFCICMILTILINDEEEMQSYIAILLQLSGAALVCSMVTFEEFKKVYTNSITVLCLISLVMYLIAMVYPGFVSLFPRIEGQASLDYYNAYVHMFGQVKGYGDKAFVLFRRNNGIFWEPGAYQAFINLGLLFVLNSMQKAQECGIRYFAGRWNRVQFIVLLLTLLTTYSTTGFLVCGILLLGYHKTVTGAFEKKANLILLLILAVPVVGYILQKGLGVSFISQKFLQDFGEDAKLPQRIQWEDMKLIFYNGLNFFGLSYSRLEELEQGTGNSLLQTLVGLGIPFTALLLRMYYQFSRYFQRRWFWVFAALLMIFSTESLFWRPLWLCLAWYGAFADGQMGQMEKGDMQLEHTNG